MLADGLNSPPNLQERDSSSDAAVLRDKIHKLEQQLRATTIGQDKQLMEVASPKACPAAAEQVPTDKAAAMDLAAELDEVRCENTCTHWILLLPVCMHAVMHMAAPRW